MGKMIRRWLERAAMWSAGRDVIKEQSQVDCVSLFTLNVLFSRVSRSLQEILQDLQRKFSSDSSRWSP